jgi:hypothetical protein
MVDMNKLQEAIHNAVIVQPFSIPEDSQIFSERDNDPSLCLIQLNYSKAGVVDFTIGKMYIKVNSMLEIAISSEYEIDAINFISPTNENRIVSSAPSGFYLADYQIDRDALDQFSQDLFMSKSNGDIYIPFHRPTGSAVLEAVRQYWSSQGRLLCYSYKIDGRISFYIKTDKILNFQIPERIFVLSNE